MTYPIDTTIPNAPNNPADDQPKIKLNFLNISNYLNVDHVLAGSTNNGQHLQVNLPSKNAQGAQTDPASVLFTQNGIASTNAQLAYKNASGTFPLSTIRAWGFVVVAGVVFTQNINVSNVVRNNQGDYSITLVANAVSSANFAVIVSCTSLSDSSSPTSRYNITGTGTFDLFFTNPSSGNLRDPTSFSFQVMQV